MKEALPALSGLPLVGNFVEFARDPLPFFWRLKRQRGDIAPFSFGGSARRVLVSHPYEVGRVLTPIIAHRKRA